MPLNYQKATLIAESIGTAAIVISMIFVGIQFNEGTKATRSSTATATIATMSSWYSEMGGNEQASYLFWNFMADPDSLSPQSRFQAIMSIHSLFLSFQNSYYLVQEGTLDIRIHKTMTETIIGVKDQPGFQLYWKSRRSLFYPEFQAYIDEILKSDKEISSGLYQRFEEGKLKNDRISDAN